MANTGNNPNFVSTARHSARQPLGPGSPPQKEQRTTSGADLQDDQHQPAQQDLPINTPEPFAPKERVAGDNKSSAPAEDKGRR